ncbi:hypothetical protein EDB84DRAFT_667791 [Lactarius hengduanensis]|nr:hypothetical protein EDB84DRAFT_667791 [Lactarius hengduanensis]
MAEHDAGDNKPLPLSGPDTDSAKSTPTTFFPENALQLQLDLDENGHDGDDEHDNEHEHESGRGHEPSPHSELQRQECQQERQQFPHQQQQQQQQQQQPPSTPFAHVRFHSRVRITSGLRHSRGTHSLDSSDSDSPSSSISAPLRYRSRDADPRGPLGQRISRLAAQALQKRRAAAAAITTSVARDEEYAPLRSAGFPVVTYGATEDQGPGSHDADGEQRSQVDLHSEEIAFGRWPWRGLNRHWWRWQIESTLCCCCSDDSEADE